MSSMVQMAAKPSERDVPGPPASLLAASAMALITKHPTHRRVKRHTFQISASLFADARAQAPFTACMVRGAPSR